MTDSMPMRLDALAECDIDPAAGLFRHGIEKESLRVDSEGTLAQTGHPHGLGSALTHPRITTDFSEGLLELVTPPFTSVRASSDYLSALHKFIYQHLDDEVLWVSSMPCVVPDDDLIPVAEYGHSNVGQMKRVYRLGLGHRYGRVMQTIAGIHFNFSCDRSLMLQLFDRFFSKHIDRSASEGEITSAAYLGLLRNFHRHCWLLLYLFGASPAVCRSFLQRRGHNLVEFDAHSVHAPHGTSLRMGDLGYQNTTQAAITVDVNSVHGYTESLIKATNTRHPPFEAIGIKDAKGAYQQLNTNLLQIENEYYAVIRPKRIARSGEKPSTALRERGVEYVEMRCIDLDPFSPNGISESTANFLLVFGLYCLLEESPPMDERGLRESQENQRQVVNAGRRPGLNLVIDNDEVDFRACAANMIAKLSDIGAAVDTMLGGDTFAASVAEQAEKLAHPEATPSARVLREMRENGESYFQFAMRRSRDSAGHFGELNGYSDELAELNHMSNESIRTQQQLEAEDQMSFDEYLRRYFAQ